MCEEIRRLAPKAGLLHDGVVFGSDDFCASIGSHHTFCLHSDSLLATQMCYSLFLFLNLWWRENVRLYCIVKIQKFNCLSVKACLTGHFPYVDVWVQNELSRYSQIMNDMEVKTHFLYIVHYLLYQDTSECKITGSLWPLTTSTSKLKHVAQLFSNTPCFIHQTFSSACVWRQLNPWLGLFWKRNLTGNETQGTVVELLIHSLFNVS